MRAVLIVIVAALVICACGPVDECACGAYGPKSPTPSIAPGLGFDLAVSETTRSATMRVGQKLEAVLHANPGMTSWSDVGSTDPTVLAPIPDPAATAVRGVTLAAFQARAPGTAHITATAEPDCSPGQACPAYLQVLTIDITVVAGQLSTRRRP